MYTDELTLASTAHASSLAWQKIQVAAKRTHRRISLPLPDVMIVSAIDRFIHVLLAFSPLHINYSLPAVAFVVA